LPLALEGAAQRERARERQRDPENACRGVADRLALPHEAAERENQHGRQREEQRRVHELTAARFDDEILARDDPRSGQRPPHPRPSAIVRR
jgi:hypothetical protein